MPEDAKNSLFETGMRRIAAYAAQQAVTQGIGLVRVKWALPESGGESGNRIKIIISMGAASVQATLTRGPIVDYARRTDTAMTDAVIRDLLRRLGEIYAKASP